MQRLIASFAFVLISVGLVAAPVSASTVSALPETVWNGQQTRPDRGLPDGEFALHTTPEGQSVAAWYGAPTDRYRHNILGDAIEAGALHVAFRDGRKFSLILPRSQVFEDRTPRIVDLDGDGHPEIITIKSFQDAGGSIAIFGIRGSALVELASNEPIGRSNRWLNIAGIADYAGTGSKQIAYVETPHIGGTLYVLEWRGKELMPIASLPGFSNHKIGSRHQDLSADIFWTGDSRPELVVPSDNLRQLRVVGLTDGHLKEIKKIELSAPVLRRIVPAENSGSGCVGFKLESGENVTLCPPSQPG
ncbi:hypothetical protein [uncultured Roseibium sp.]|uniref:hypothetical protein n=1 Tax=uncultured Roseibium sp. TaxID=1936171 RepID=UPI002633FE0D|nr:hypothetical protein [uncultured Roseibium sp.]